MSAPTLTLSEATALAMRIGIDLGIEGGADALCESAGWPS